MPNCLHVQIPCQSFFAGFVFLLCGLCMFLQSAKHQVLDTKMYTGEIAAVFLLASGFVLQVFAGPVLPSGHLLQTVSVHACTCSNASLWHHYSFVLLFSAICVLYNVDVDQTAESLILEPLFLLLYSFSACSLL